MSSASPSRRILLIDGYGFVFRAYHSMPALTRPDGAPIGAVYGFTSMVMKLLSDIKTDHVAVILDKGRQNFRHDLYADYKANRPPAPEDLIPQFPLVREAAEALNLPVIDADGYEADDIIATYARMAREAGESVTIVSSDKDLMQLVGGGVDMYDPLKNRKIGAAEVEEKFGVGPEKVLDMLALMGDSSDNIPGVPGIGPKTAAELLTRFGDLETLLARAGEITQQKRRETLITHADTARLSRQLASLCDQVPVTLSLADLAVRENDSARLIAFLKAQGFKNLLSRIEKQHNIATERTPALEATKAVAWETVTDTTQLGNWLEKARSTGYLVLACYADSADTPSRLAGMGLLTGAEACYIPIAAENTGSDLFATPSGGNGIAITDIYTTLAPVLNDPGILKIGYDIKAAIVTLAAHSPEAAITPYDDVMLLSYVLEAGSHSHEMEKLVTRHLGKDCQDSKALLGSGRNALLFSELAADKQTTYIQEHLTDLYNLHHLLKQRLFEAHLLTVYEGLERPLTPVLAAMETTGVKVNAARLQSLSEEFSAKLVVLEEEIYHLAGRSFNIGSPKQMGEVLFDEMGLVGGGKTATGAYSTGADVLEELALQGYSIAEKILEWRQLSKLKSTYTDALVKQINPKTGRIHSHFQMAVTSTGRLSSIHPNLQNIPVRTEEGTKIRSAFVAKEGHVLLSADYSQIELRLLAHMADIPALKSAFAEGRDIHATTASEVFGIPLAQIDSATRRKAKAINFGIIYGISAFGLARQLGIARGEASEYIKAYFKEYPGIEAYMERTKLTARQQGYVETLFGRRCHVPGINDKNAMKRSFAERAAINAPLQGTAADIIKKAMIQLPSALQAAGLTAAMMLQVHDELVLEVPEVELEQTKQCVEHIMMNVASLDVPLEVGVATGKNWAEI